LRRTLLAVVVEREEVMMVVVAVAGSQDERVDSPSVVRGRLEAFGVEVLAEAMNRPAQVWFASESMTQIRVLISPHLRGFRHDQQEGLDDRAGTFSRQRRGPSSEAVSLAFAEV
jgi:hypothetical protein